MAKQVQIKKDNIPDGWSKEAADFINRVIKYKIKYLILRRIYCIVFVYFYKFQLLQRKPSNRLGQTGAAEVKEHSWLKHFPWKDLYQKKLESPFVPKVINK